MSNHQHLSEQEAQEKVEAFLQKIKEAQIRAKYVTVFNKILSKRVVPTELICSLEEYTQESYAPQAYRFLARVVLYKETTLTPEEKLTYLHRAATFSKDVAYEVGMILTDQSEFFKVNFKKLSNEIKTADFYFAGATLLKHPLAFEKMLKAINSGMLKLTGDEFKGICEDLISETQDLYVIFTLGELCFGRDLVQWPQLQKNLKIYNPNDGYHLLIKIIHFRNKQLDSLKEKFKDNPAALEQAGSALLNKKIGSYETLQQMYLRAKEILINGGINKIFTFEGCEMFFADCERVLKNRKVASSSSVSDQAQKISLSQHHAEPTKLKI